MGFNAKTTIAEWNKGNLKFPIEKDGKILYVDANELKSLIRMFVYIYL